MDRDGRDMNRMTSKYNTLLLHSLEDKSEISLEVIQNSNVTVSITKRHMFVRRGVLVQYGFSAIGKAIHIIHT